MAQEQDHLYPMRHSAAHILASAVQHLYPGAKFGVGPVIENGFYYDFDLRDTALSVDDLIKIEKEMTKIISEDQPFDKSVLSIGEAIEWAKDSDQPYKLELLNDLKKSGTTDVKDIDPNELGTDSDKESSVESVSFYANGDFQDLCRGPHVESTGKVGPFKLLRVSGAYWRGNENNKQMQRVYGVAFDSKDKLDNYLKSLEEAKNRDHRKLGQELDLYVISPLVGAGLPMFTPRGTVLREELNQFSQGLRERDGYQRVWTPHIAKKELYETSGHWAKFGDEWLKVESQETSDQLVMKPMNCPHHQQIYASRARSYKELPIKYMETTTVYRDEKAGELLGLARVRSITQDDTHVFCTPDQIKDVMNVMVAIVKEFYAALKLPIRVRLSFRDDSDGYLGDIKLWEKAQKILKEVIEENNLEYYEGFGEAAFYGPKIDFMATDALGRESQVATPQLDFVQPERFGLKYADSDGKDKTPVMVHFALMGSIERFLGLYIEHTAGRFPLWLAPEQIRIITLNQSDEITNYANDILIKAKELGLRANLDNENESVGKKIRQAVLFKIPYTIVIGGKEVESGQVSPRVRQDLAKDEEEAKTLSLDEFLAKVSQEHISRADASTI